MERIKAQERKGRPPVQWFVECGDPFSNESLAAALAERGISDAESKCVSVMGMDGRRHDVILVPAYMVMKLRAAKRGDSRFKYRFFKRDGPSGPICRADFLEKRRRSKKVRAVETQLESLCDE